MSQTINLEVDNECKNSNIIISLFKIVLGIVLLKVGGDISVNNAVEVARILGVSEKVIGLTIVAIGTSLPELITSIVAAFHKNTDIAIGNIVGSNIFNILLIIGVAAVISPMQYNGSYNGELLFLLISSVMLFLFGCFGKKDTMTRKKGLIYVLMYTIYILSITFI